MAELPSRATWSVGHDDEKVIHFGDARRGPCSALSLTALAQRPDLPAQDHRSTGALDLDIGRIDLRAALERAFDFFLHIGLAQLRFDQDGVGYALDAVEMFHCVLGGLTLVLPVDGAVES